MSENKDEVKQCVELFKKTDEERKILSAETWEVISKMKSLKEFLIWCGIRKALFKYIEETFQNLLDYIKKHNEVLVSYLGEDINNEKELFYHIYHSSGKVRRRLKILDSVGVLIHFGKLKYGDNFEKMYENTINNDEAYEKLMSECNDEVFRELGYYFNYISQDMRLSKDYYEEVSFEHGFPELRRGNMCKAYVPVKNLNIFVETNKKDLIGEIELYNPRKKKNEKFILVDVMEEDDLFYCKLTQGERVIFICDYDDLSSTYSDLHTINKSLYAGWWNKELCII